ncbi:MBL fold metallo-hydrolase [Vibrio parahaemolyticus]|nr:MBL fold metallo-hydrolase [Vibrio parahaemolyticus]
MINMTFIGHQSWLIECNGTKLLVDPVLTESFGNSLDVTFLVYPPRIVNTCYLHDVDAIYLSHEHLDHFSLDSLNLLPRSIVVFVGYLMPDCVNEAITQLGFEVIKLPPYSPISLKGIKITIYPAPINTVFWEKRVGGLVIDDLISSDSIYIAVDATISDDLARKISSGTVSTPRCVIISNNSQILPNGAIGTKTNLLDINKDNSLSGVKLIYELIVNYMKILPKIENVIICGNGFLNEEKKHGPFLYSDNKELARVANILTQDIHTYGPYPGEILSLQQGRITTYNCNWINYDSDKHQRFKLKQEQFLSFPSHETIKPLSKINNLTCSDIELLDYELKHLARHLIRSKLGHICLTIHEYLDQPLGSIKLVIVLTKSNNEHDIYGLDFASASFVKLDDDINTLLSKYPYGIQLFLHDFIQVLNGKIQIWDLFGSAMRQWFLTDIYSNISSCFFEVFGEQLRPDLAKKIYDRKLERLEFVHGKKTS